MSGFRDIHAHFIYGIDDGARTRADMEAMLDMAHENGVGHLCATPHVTPGVYPFDQELFLNRLEEARAYCLEKEYAMSLYAGAEIMYTPMIKRCAAEGSLPVMGDTSWILMEFVPDIAYEDVEDAVSRMERSGYGVILAHVERYECLYRKRNAYRLRESHDVRYQVNCSSVIDSRGFFKDRQIKKWIRDGLISCVSSDMHDGRRRPCRMKDAYASLCRMAGKETADRLTGLI